MTAMNRNDQRRGSGPIAGLGCGPGHVTRYLAARHPNVTGIDVSPKLGQRLHSR